MGVMKKPLEGIKVLELGNFVAAPFVGKIFGEFGAEVIKVEDPGKGDSLRNWRVMHHDTSVWWYVHARNKKSITINLREEAGQEMIRELAKEVDVVIENFRPGTLERWGIGYEDLKQVNPSIIMTRISGYGQTGPYRDKVGFGSVAESMGGLRYLTGFPDRPPVRVGLAIGDSIAALYAALGTLMALRVRDNVPSRKGQYVDVALTESVFSLLEGVLPEYDLKGIIRERTGATLEGIAPSNTYLCGDGKYIVIAANSDGIFKRFVNAMERPELAEDPVYASNQGRAENVDYLDKIIEDWTKQHTQKEVQQILDEARVPVGPIYSIEDIVNDEQYQARDMLQTVELPDGKSVRVPGVVPKLSETPGDIGTIGPELGENNSEYLPEIKSKQ